MCQAPESQCFELAFSDHNLLRRILEKRFPTARREIQHIRSPGRAEIFLPWPQVSRGIIFEIGLIPTKPIFAYVIRRGREVGNENACEIPALPTNHLSAGQRIDSTWPGSVGQVSINPSGFERRVVRCAQRRSDRCSSADYSAILLRATGYKRCPGECVFFFCA